MFRHILMPVDDSPASRKEQEARAAGVPFEALVERASRVIAASPVPVLVYR